MLETKDPLSKQLVDDAFLIGNASTRNTDAQSGSKNGLDDINAVENGSGYVRRSVPHLAAEDVDLKWQSGSSTRDNYDLSADKGDGALPLNMPKSAPVPISGMVAAISPIRFSYPSTEPYPAPELDVWATDSPCLRRSTLSDSTDQQSPEVFIPLSFDGNADRGMMELNDATWDQPALQNEFNHKSKDPFTDTTGEFEAREPTIEAVPEMEPRRDSRRQNYPLTSSNGSLNSNTQDWEEANERVLSAAIQCLSRGKDMEQAYVCILSTINVMQRCDRPQCTSLESARKLLRIMTQPRIAERLGSEIRRQGELTPGALYHQVYQAIQDACYPLEAHGATGKPNRDYQERERASRVMIQKWFKLQLEVSKWEELKTQYERRRARLMEAPANIDRFLSSLSLIEAENKPEQTKDALQACQQVHCGEGSTTLSLSSTPSSSATSLFAPSLKSASTATVDDTPRPESEAAKAVPTKRRFSFLSAFKSTSSSSLAKAKNSTTAATTAPPNVDTRKLKSAKSPPNLNPLQTPIGQSNIHVSRHLTVLDNGMLEECINHKQFEYGWKHVYERMGPARLEDKDTAKIAMRLCKRAFLGHGGLSPHLKRGSSSPNMLARELCFEDDRLSNGEKECEDESKVEGIGAEYEDEAATKRDRVLPGDHSGSGSWKKNYEEDAEVWEARAWVIYNKATMNPFFFSSAGNSPSGSPVQSQQPTATTSAQGASTGPGAARGSALSLSSPIAVMAGTTSLAVFLHNILTVAIHSPERSSRFMKAFKVYCAMRNDPLNKYQAQLRDPFVMTCIFKAIYDTVLAIVRAQSTEQHQTPQMTIGPLMDLAFEIYADMRNVGPIRHLPRLSALAPLTPLPRTPKTPGYVHQPSSLTESNVNPSLSGSMSMFFNLSNRPSTLSSLTTVDLSACGTTDTTNGVSTATAATTTSSFKKTALPVAPAVQLLLQDLNPTLQPNPQARRLPNELYLALLHLCIQVPLSGLSTSFKVVKTIVSDMMSTLAGQQPANLDSHLAAALQFYHDRWMCRPQELKERNRHCSGHDDHSSCDSCPDHDIQARKERDCSSAAKVSHDGHDDQDEDDDKDDSGNYQSGHPHEGCIFHGWMYQPESYILKHMTPSNVSSTNSSLSDLCDAHFPTELSTTTTSTVAEAATAPPGSSSSSNIEMDLPIMENENSQYGIFKHDADLDELDQYLNARMQPVEKGIQTSKRSSNCSWVATSEQSARAHWMDGLEHDSCNDRFYWDLWSRQDPVLQTVRFSRRRARMLWRHVDSMDM
ncbi:hypothetical protein BGZ72_007559 [Mortierella alpina]|nr:hypothetical protein BGZ72_007559 [Mortierella alpina]